MLYGSKSDDFNINVMFFINIAQQYICLNSLQLLNSLTPKTFRVYQQALHQTEKACYPLQTQVFHHV